MCCDDYAHLAAIVFSPWQAKVNANGLFLPDIDADVVAALEFADVSHFNWKGEPRPIQL